MNRENIINAGWINQDGSQGPVDPFEDLGRDRVDPVKLSLGVESGAIPVQQAIKLSGIKGVSKDNEQQISGQVIKLNSEGRDKAMFAIVSGGKSYGIPFIGNELRAKMTRGELGLGDFDLEACKLSKVEINGLLFDANGKEIEGPSIDDGEGMEL